MADDEVHHSLAYSMMEMKELAAPIEEAARGMRNELVGEYGWTDESADHMACEWYVLVMRHIQAQAGKANTQQ